MEPAWTVVGQGVEPAPEQANFTVSHVLYVTAWETLSITLNVWNAEALDGDQTRSSGAKVRNKTMLAIV